MCARVSGLASPETALSSLSMKSSLSIAYAQSRAVLVPAGCSQMPILRTGKVAEIIQGFDTPKFIRQQTCHSFKRVVASGFDSSRDDPVLCGPIESRGVGVMLQDSSEAQCPKGKENPKDERGEDHLKDEGREELASKDLSLRSDTPGDFDDPSSSVVTNDERVEELAKVVDSLSRCLIFVTGQLETLARQNEAPFGTSKGYPGVDGMGQSAQEDLKPLVNEKDPENPRGRMESRKTMQRNGLKRSLTGRLGSRRRHVKLNDDIAAINKIREEDEAFMGAALIEAKQAAMAGEVPVGAVIVQQGKIIARAHNRVESAGDPTAHAEMLCLRSAARHQEDWRLVDATVYVTLEPCPMCAGAILQSRVKGLVWGSRNTLLGADGSWVSLFPELVEDEMDVDSSSEHEPRNRPLTHPFHTSLEVRRGVLAGDCSAIMQNFFKARRKVNGNSMKTKPWWLPLPAWMLFKKLLRLLSFLERV